MQVTIEGITLDVEYSIERGYPATREEPGMPDHLDEFAVKLAGHDITELLSKPIITYIEDLCWRDAERLDLENFDEPDLPEY